MSTPDLNSIFGKPSTVENTTTTETPSLNDLFGNNNQNAVASENVISSNNVQIAVEDVKKVVRDYQEKGYSVSIEELDLDREIQLIVKFNKN